MSEATAELAVHLAAAAVQADAAALCDSESFMARVAGLGPDTPGFVGRVQAAVEEAATTARAGQSAAPQGGVVPEPVAARTHNELLAFKAARRAQLTAGYEGEITEQDVQDADARVVGEWSASGKLAHLGVPPQKRHRRR